MFKPQDKGPRMHCFSCIVWCSHRNKKEEAQVSNYHLWAEETLFLSDRNFQLFSPFFEDFSAAQPFLLQQVNTNLFMIFFLSRTIDFFFLCLWIYLWLAETSQQPISQTTWLKVTPHCNHKKEDTFPKIWHADTSGFVLKPGTSTLSFYDLESLTRSFHWMLVKLLTRHRQAAHYNGYTTQNYSVLCKRADTKAEKKHSAAKTSDSI